MRSIASADLRRKRAGTFARQLLPPAQPLSPAAMTWGKTSGCSPRAKLIRTILLCRGSASIRPTAFQDFCYPPDTQRRDLLGNGTRRQRCGKKASADPVGLLAGTAAMIAVAAMACQYALLRLAVPGAISTTVMTGNLANAVLSAMDLLTDRRPLLPHDSTPLNRSLGRLFGFVFGCVVAAAATSLAGDWAWSLPAALAAVAIAVR